MKTSVIGRDTSINDENVTAPGARARRRRPALSRFVILGALFAGLIACVGSGDASDDDGDGSDDEHASTSEALQTAGPCAGTAIDRAVKCAQAKGARVLSFYRSPVEQERVRRQNGCIDRCTGSAGCVRPTAGCYSSPHTKCRAVDFVADGAPATRAQLRACGLAKTTAPHANHYDLVN
jgi:hypothetical protein